MTIRLPTMIASLALLLPLGSALPAAAAPNDAAMLASYAGNYTGAGAFTGGGTRPQKITCRLNMQSVRSGALNYTGRCSAGGAGFSMTGVITASQGRIEAAMSGSGGGMSGQGTVTGTRRGNGVSFSSKTRDTTATQDSSIASNFSLSGGTVKLEFSMLDHKTGKTTSGTVTFSKR